MLRRFLDSPRLYFGLAGLMLVIAIVSQVEVRLPSRSMGTVQDIAALRERNDVNVVFVLIDTLRADRLSSYGYSRPTSPAMDMLAQHGVRFASTMSQSSWTKSSMASLWTGMYPGTHGLLRWPHALPAAAKLPAEVLKEAGFVTAGIWRNGWVDPNFGFGQGFDVYLRPTPRRFGVFQRRNPSSHPLQGTDADLTDSAVEFLRSASDKRFFLYVHYMDVHQYAYDELAARFGTSYSDVYDNSISWVDRNVGTLVSELEKLSLMPRTLVVIASDHGEGFREHGGEGHARTLYTEVIDVPLIFVFPFRMEPGIVVKDRVQNVDVWPTILDLLGLGPLPGAEGRSLVPLMLAAGGAAPPAEETAAFAHIDRYWGSTGRAPEPWVQVTEGRYRLIRRLDGDSVRPELYDHATDPREQKNIAETDPQTRERLEARLQQYLSAPKPDWGTPSEVEIEEMRLEQLRALGYVIQGP